MRDELHIIGVLILLDDGIEDGAKVGALYPEDVQGYSLDNTHQQGQASTHLLGVVHHTLHRHDLRGGTSYIMKDTSSMGRN